MTPHGFCECGCGERTAIAPRTDAAKRWKKGEPKPWIAGHAHRRQSGERNPRWAGGRSSVGGYPTVLMPGHPRAVYDRYVPEHIVIAERAVGHALPRGAEVHHVDRNRSNNAHSNLVVCQDRAYHTLLHQRQRAFEACGDACAHKCGVCKKWDQQDEIVRNGRSFYHRDCRNRRHRDRYAAKHPPETWTHGAARKAFIAAIAEEPLTTKQVAERTGRGYQPTRTLACDLARRGVVVRVAGGRYALPEFTDRAGRQECAR